MKGTLVVIEVVLFLGLWALVSALDCFVG